LIAERHIGKAIRVQAQHALLYAQHNLAIALEQHRFKRGNGSNRSRRKSIVAERIIDRTIRVIANDRCVTGQATGEWALKAQLDSETRENLGVGLNGDSDDIRNSPIDSGRRRQYGQGCRNERHSVIAETRIEVRWRSAHHAWGGCA
jgi:hypothetical protein